MQEIRNDFPVFSNQPNLVYLDSAATSLKPVAVLEAIRDYDEHFSANVHRSLSTISQKATNAYEGARAQVAKLINAPDPKNVIFTHGATESINLVRYGWAQNHLERGDRILLSIMEHHSNYVPWITLAKDYDLVVDICPLTADFRLDMEEFARLLKQKPKLVAIAAASNVLGTVNPIEEIVTKAHATGAAVAVDATQLIAHQPIDVQKWAADFVAFSGHKMFGPTGVGVLYIARRRLEQVSPFIFGGEMVSRVSNDWAEWAEPPLRFEAGTPPIAQAIGLGAACEYLTKTGYPTNKKREPFYQAGLKSLQKLPFLELIGPPTLKDRLPIFSFTIKGIPTHDVVEILNTQGVMVRAGFQCAEPLHTALNLQGSVRASFQVYNTPKDLERLIQALKAAWDTFNG